MPKIITRKESSGNGKQTCIVNMGDVAHAIKRPPQYTTKWFEIEFGLKSNYTNKKGEGERTLMKGHQDAHVFQSSLDKFLDKYVLCPACHLPETNLIVKKKRISAKCMACGWAGALDNGHKLANYITKNPPDESGLNLRNSTVEGVDGKSDKKLRREKKQKLAADKKKADRIDDGNGDDDTGDYNESSVEEKHDKIYENDKKDQKDKKDKKRKTEKTKKKDKAMNNEGDDDDDNDDDEAKKKDTKEKKEKKEKKDKKEKKEKKTKAIKDAEKDDDDADDSDAGCKGQAQKKKGGELKYDDEELKPVINMLAGLAESKGNSLKAADYLEELTNHRLAKNFDQKTALYVTMEALCSKEMDAKALEDKATYFDEVIGSQKLSDKDVLWALGAYLDMNSGARRFFAQMLKVVFDRDWAEEKTILEFYNEGEGASTPAFADAQQAASPCLKWLAEADEDDDDEDSDSDDESDD